ncbi:MAG TPA: DedA family protein [Blastocatellia bacterium]|nr:DedA family protein [Blastocatellia bacterium]
MELLKQFVDLILHLDKHLVELVNQYQSWTYGILFLIIFCETGLVVTPFLPGDSLLFAVGALASKGELNVFLVVVLLISAAVIGDSVNYWIGRTLGPRVFSSESSRWFNRKHLERTHAFYEKYGGKTLIFARFMPIIRTFAPFVAGIGKMTYIKFLSYSLSGGILWISLLTYAGYFFGEIPIVKRNFSLVIVGVIAVSLLPAVIEFLRSRRQEKTTS